MQPAVAQPPITPAPQPAPPQFMDVVVQKQAIEPSAPTPAVPPAKQPADTSKQPATHNPPVLKDNIQKPSPAAAPKPSTVSATPGTTLAVIATVVIILGLAVMAIYAYNQMLH